jgi:transcriptional regulator with XRE-family HTH domain
MAVTEKNTKFNGFSKRLRELRKQQGLTQTELGNLVDLHYTLVGRYESGSSMPSAETLISLAEILNVSIDYLLIGNTVDVATSNLKDKDLLKMFKETEKLNNKDKELVKQILDSFLTKKKLEETIKEGII